MVQLATATVRSGLPGGHMAIPATLQTGEPRERLALIDLATSAVRPIAYEALPRIYDVLFEVLGAGTSYRSQGLMGWSVDESTEGGTAWSVDVAPFDSSGARRPLGVELDYIAPPPGRLPVDLAVILLSAAGESRYTVARGGIADNSRREIYPQRMTITGLGKMGHYDRKRVTLKLDARAGWTHGKIIRQLALNAGIPAAEVKVPADLGSPRMKPVDIIDEEFPAAVAPVGEAAGYAIDFNRDGDLVAIPLVPEGEPEVTFRPRAIQADGSASVDVVGEVPTCYIFEGSAPEGAPSQEGQRIKRRVVTIIGDVELENAQWIQNSGVSGTLVARSVPETVSLSQVPKKRTTIEEVFRGGCLRERWTTEELYLNPVAARYQIDTAGDIDSYLGPVYIMEAGAVADDQSEAHLWPIAKFTVSSITGEGYKYDLLGRQTKVEKVVGLWRNREAALKSRSSPADDWESQAFLTQKTEAGGRPVVHDTELFFRGGRYTGGVPGFQDAPNAPDSSIPVEPRERLHKWAEYSRRDVSVTPENYITGEEEQRFGFGAAAGFEYLFDGGDEKAADKDGPGFELGGEIISYDAEEGSGLTTVTTDVLAEGKIGDSRIEEGDGYLPNAEICDGELADRGANRQIEVKVCAFEDAHAEHAVRVSNDYVESEAEAEALLIRKLRREVPPRVQFPVAISPGIERGMVCRVFVPQSGIDHEGWIDQVSHRAQEGAPATTAATMIVRV